MPVFAQYVCYAHLSVQVHKVNKLWALQVDFWKEDFFPVLACETENQEVRRREH